MQSGSADNGPVGGLKQSTRARMIDKICSIKSTFILLITMSLNTTEILTEEEKNKALT